MPSAFSSQAGVSPSPTSCAPPTFHPSWHPISPRCAAVSPEPPVWKSSETSCALRASKTSASVRKPPAATSSAPGPPAGTPPIMSSPPPSKLSNRQAHAANPHAASSMTATVEHIWETLASQLRSFIRSRVRDHTTAEDILQEVFLKIHEKLPSLRAGDRLEAWIWRITRNAIADYFRRLRPTEPLP